MKTDHNAKIKYIEDKIKISVSDHNPNINEIRDKISDVSNLVKKRIIMLRSMIIMVKQPN